MNHNSYRVLSFLMLFSFPLFAQDPQQGWDFNYPNDDFTGEALLDLRYLNEETAGDNGFIRLSEDGGHFVNDQGPIRFWAVNGGELVRNHDPSLSGQDLATYARFLAKMGVNMIRYHGEAFSSGNDINSPNLVETEYIWRVVAAMKKEGIYTTISPFWPAHLGSIPESWGLGDYVGDIDPWGLIYFDQNFRNAYKSWVTYLYTQVNPRTGLALKDDPSVAIVQIINEDGVFFWTIGAVQPSLNRLMQEQFYEWADNTYGSYAQALTAWEQTSLGQDDSGQGLLEIIPIWNTTDDPNVPPQSSGFKKRLSDQMRFFAETQRAVYQELYDHYRDIGCKQLINASNWRTASSSRLLDLERWSTLPTEIVALNRYYDPGHFGPNNGWRIERLDHYQGNSAMFYPHRLPINVKQVEGKPFLITESGWNLPHKYQAEGPFLISAYQSLYGLDGFYWFSPSSTTFEDDPYWPYFGQINGEEPMYRWTMSTPGQLAMFPANALSFRMGYIQEGEAVVKEERSFQSMADRELPVITEEKSFDPNRDEYDPNTGAGETVLSPLTYLAGPVKVKYDGNPGNTSISTQLDELVNIEEKLLTSNTGELSWDYQQGICVLDAPKAQGICGFPGDNEYELTDVTISSSNDYVVVNVVSMDDEPLSSSEKILIQVGTVYQPTGWKETATKFRPGENSPEIDAFLIESLGQMPWKAADSEVSIRLKNDKIKSAWQLDAAGYKNWQLDLTDNGEAITINLRPSTMYVVLDTTQTTTGLNPVLQEDGQIRVFPNPNNGAFRIDIPSAYDQLDPDSIEVWDLGGKKLETFPYQEGKKYELQVPSGLYLIRLNTKKAGWISRKILIE